MEKATTHALSQQPHQPEPLPAYNPFESDPDTLHSVIQSLQQLQIANQAKEQSQLQVYKAEIDQLKRDNYDLIVNLRKQQSAEDKPVEMTQFLNECILADTFSKPNQSLDLSTSEGFGTSESEPTKQLVKQIQQLKEDKRIAETKLEESSRFQSNIRKELKQSINQLTTELELANKELASKNLIIELQTEQIEKMTAELIKTSAQVRDAIEIILSNVLPEKYEKMAIEEGLRMQITPEMCQIDKQIELNGKMVRVVGNMQKLNGLKHGSAFHVTDEGLTECYQCLKGHIVGRYFVTQSDGTEITNNYVDGKLEGFSIQSSPNQAITITQWKNNIKDGIIVIYSPIEKKMGYLFKTNGDLKTLEFFAFDSKITEEVRKEITKTLI